MKKRETCLDGVLRRLASELKAEINQSEPPDVPIEEISRFYEEYRAKYGTCPAELYDDTTRGVCSISRETRPATCPFLDPSYTVSIIRHHMDGSPYREIFCGCSFKGQKKCERDYEK